MEEAKFKAQIKGAIVQTVGLLVLLVVFGLLLWGFFSMVRGINEEVKKDQAETDAKSRFVSVNDNGIKVVTDKETGCQYTQGFWDTKLTPILDDKGNAMCGK